MFRGATSSAIILGGRKGPARAAVLCAFLSAAISLASCSTVTKMPVVDKADAAREAETEHELIVHDIETQYQRLSNVAFPMLEHSIELCQAKTKLSVEGVWANKYSFGKEYNETMTRIGYAETATLAATGSGSALAAVGIVPGDTLVAIDGWPVPKGESAVKAVYDKFDELLKQRSTVHLSMTTKNGPRDIDVPGRKICAFNFAIVHADFVDAATDGENIILTTGLTRFAQNDVELATVFGHEMAHDVMGHVGKQKTSRIFGDLLDALTMGISAAFRGGRAGATTPEFESEADYVGLYLTARAGYSVDGAANLWRRMALAQPASADAALAKDHPPTPERFVLLEKTAAEIDNKIRTGAPLVPEMAKQ